MNPYRDPEVMQYVKRFLRRYYSDNRRRIAVFGINPGRFGAGITGITFMDPVALETLCGIQTDLPKRREPSSVFVYAFADRFGGPAKPFRDFFFTAVSPLGFTKDRYNKEGSVPEAREIRPESGMDFCDLNCKYATFPASEAVDGSRSCRTFIALYCKKKEGLVHKNLPCGDKQPVHDRAERPRGAR